MHIKPSTSRFFFNKCFYWVRAEMMRGQMLQTFRRWWIWAPFLSRLIFVMLRVEERAGVQVWCVSACLQARCTEETMGSSWENPLEKRKKKRKVWIYSCTSGSGSLWSLLPTPRYNFLGSDNWEIWPEDTRRGREEELKIDMMEQMQGGNTGDVEVGWKLL